MFSKITNLTKDGVCSSGHTSACIRHQMPEIGEIKNGKNGNKNIHFLKEIMENGMVDDKCNEELRTINTNITINKRCEVCITRHRGTFVQPLLQWKSNKHCTI